MQFKNRNTQKYRKAVKLLRSKNTRCIICESRIRLTGVLIMDNSIDDVKGIRCIECISAYDTDFSIEQIGFAPHRGIS